MKKFNWHFVLAIIAALITVLLVVEIIQSRTSMSIDQVGLGTEAYRASMNAGLLSMPISTQIYIPIAWVIAAFAGTLVGSMIHRDKKRQIFFVVAIFTLSAAAMFILMFNPPWWFWLPAAFIFPASLLGSRLVKPATSN